MLMEIDDFKLVNPIDNIKVPSEVSNTIISKEDCSSPTLSSDHNFDLPFERDNFNDEKELFTFVNKLKRIIVNTPEYKEWVKYVTEELEINNCVITEESNEDVTIEIHHHPIPMHILIKTVVSNKIEKNMKFTSLDILKEVMKLHFENKVGYTALCTTLHEKFNNSKLDIPIDLCHGNYKEFINEYNLDKEDMEYVKRLMSIKSTNQKKW